MDSAKKILWLGMVALSLAGCSDDEDLADLPNSPTTEYAHDFDEAYESDEDRLSEEEPDEETYLLRNGYRKGTLTVDLEIRQAAIMDETEPDTDRSDYESLTLSLVTVAKRPVWLPPEFNELVPFLNDPELSPTAWQTQPYFDRDDTGFVIDGSGTFTLARTWDAPQARDVVHGTRNVKATAEVIGLTITKFEPSLLGKGHDFDAEWLVVWNITEDSAVMKQRNGQVLTLDEPREEDERLELNLFPTLNPDGLNPYPLSNEDDPNIEQMVRDNMQMLYDAVRQVEAAKVLGVIRTGLVTEMGQDRVVLSYRYSGHEQVPYFPDSLANTVAFTEQHEITENSMNVTVTLEALD